MLEEIKKMALFDQIIVAAGVVILLTYIGPPLIKSISVRFTSRRKPESRKIVSPPGQQSSPKIQQSKPGEVLNLAISTKECPDCGNTLVPEDARFCPSCGYSFKQ